MKALPLFILLGTALSIPSLRADPLLLKEDFHPELPKGFSWLRENPAGWRMSPKGLEIRVEPGNMWGPANNARNVLLYPLPKDVHRLELEATVENRPSEQYEQVDLLWYFSESDMVKIGHEQVDGQLSIVMGREEKDRTQTITIIPLSTHVVDLRLRVDGSTIAGYYRPRGKEEWIRAGECELPPAHDRIPHLSIQVYQGAAAIEHWATIHRLEVRRWQ